MIVIQAQTNHILLFYQYQIWGRINAQESPEQKEGSGRRITITPGKTPEWPSQLGHIRTECMWNSLSSRLHQLCSHNHHIINTYKRICVWSVSIYWGTPKYSANPSPSKHFIRETKGPSFAGQCAKIFTWTILLNSPKSPAGRHYYYYHHLISK